MGQRFFLCLALAASSIGCDAQPRQRTENIAGSNASVRVVAQVNHRYFPEGSERVVMLVIRDDEHAVTCYLVPDEAASCIPDATRSTTPIEPTGN